MGYTLCCKFARSTNSFKRDDNYGAVSNVFALYNAEKQESYDKPFTVQRVYYNNLIQTSGKASQCIHCRNCEKHCPQHIKISEWMGEIAKTFEG